jgi:hypothetical protein
MAGTGQVEEVRAAQLAAAAAVTTAAAAAGAGAAGPGSAPMQSGLAMAPGFLTCMGMWTAAAAEAAIGVVAAAAAALAAILLEQSHSEPAAYIASKSGYRPPR